MHTTPLHRWWPTCGRAIAIALGTGAVAAGCGGAPGEATPTSPTPPETTTEPAPERLDLVAREFDWEGIPDELPAGTYLVSFRNDGDEPHEVFFFRNPDEVPLEALLAAGPGAADGLIEPAGKIIAGPGQAGDEIVVELAPGTYQVACFFPTPTDGRAHFEHGMHRTLEVVAR